MPQKPKSMNQRKSDFATGLEFLMNKSPMNPMSQQGSAVFNQAKQASGLPLATMMKYVGQQSKRPNIEQQRIETRLGGLQQ